MRPIIIVLGSLLLVLSSFALSQEEVPEEIIIIGKQPGPPLWKVINGENVLWIFGTVSPVPEDLVWESKKVATVIAQSQEYLARPNVEPDFPMHVLLNPINIVRGMRLAKRLSRNADEATLDEVLPPDLYERFSVLKSQYFPENERIDKLRPFIASDAMAGLVLEKAGLTYNSGAMKEIQKLLKRNKTIKRTESQVEQKIDGNYRTLAKRAETFMEGVAPENELACFSAQLERMEQDLDGMKRRANAWAAGYVDELRSIHVPFAETVCARIFTESSEFELMQASQEQADAMWLNAAVDALNTNESTFAVLDMDELLGEGGLFSQLKARGYQAVEP